MIRQDLLHLCVRNLLRRKARTVLTILGMLIGCSSIIIMVSLGIGMREAREKILSSLGDLTIITVRAPSSNRSSGRLDDALLRQLREMDGVAAVTPKLTLDVNSVTLSTGSNGHYLAEWTNVVGVDTSAMEDMGYEFLQGTPAIQSGQAVMGEYFAYNFRDTTLPEGADIIDRFDGEWDDQGNQLTVPDPFFDPLDRPCTMEIETDSGLFSIPVDLVGKIKADYSKGNETAEGILIPMEDLLHLQAQVNGVSKSDVVYDSILVKVSRVNRVEGVENRIKAMGYTTESMEEVRKPMEKEAQQQQMMLGGLGAISLLVATLGIINTMIMSISERTREIGIMKALGCPVADIRAMFLTEAGAIGLIGGLLGCVFSLLLSAVINLVATALSPSDFLTTLLGCRDVTRVSVIPWWLLVFSLVFSVLIGLGAGYYPASKAVRISALEAIKNE